jgi:hypothetical protein
MVVYQALQTSNPELEQMISRWIQQRIWGRVRCLQITVGEDWTVVRGHTETCHVKQLVRAIRRVDGHWQQGRRALIKACACTTAITDRDETATLEGRRGHVEVPIGHCRQEVWLVVDHENCIDIEC